MPGPRIGSRVAPHGADGKPRAPQAAARRASTGLDPKRAVTCRPGSKCQGGETCYGATVTEPCMFWRMERALVLEGARIRELEADLLAGPDQVVRPIGAVEQLDAMCEVVVVRPGDRRPWRDHDRRGHELVGRRQVDRVGCHRTGRAGRPPRRNRRRAARRRCARGRAPRQRVASTVRDGPDAPDEPDVPAKKALRLAATKIRPNASRLSTSLIVWANRNVVQSRW